MTSIKIKHPDFGYVIFENMSPRQMDVLKKIKSPKKKKFKKPSNGLATQFDSY
jgi:hypothetical protein